MAKEVQKKKKIKRCREDVIYDTVIFIILTVLLLIVAYPLYFIIISSISDPTAVAGGKVVWRPIGINLRGYVEVFKDDRIVRSFINSLIYTFCGTLVNLGVTLPTAYALSRSKFKGKGFVTTFYLITMFIGGGMIPTYLVVQKTGLLDTMW
ncbi:MAG: carbohydrate ABC transporter permease, partial [Fusicatenibacter sp.]|nr:carbohydrate ABC transporter permease [Fusicatenibacter sp.]